MKKMSMRDRMRAVIRGQAPDLVPFVQYENLAAPDEEVWELVGRDSMGILRWTSVYRLEYPNSRSHSEPFERDGLMGLRSTIVTPLGALTEERLYEPVYHTSSIRKHYVTRPEEYDLLGAYLEDGVVVEDLEPLQRAYQELGEQGLPLVRVERTPFQQLWVQWVSMEDLALHLVDCPERVARCVDAMTRQQRRVFEIVARAPVEFVDFPDNITAPIIGEANFRRYCVPPYQELAGMLADKDVPVYVHMDGDLKPLWPAIGDSGVKGLDSLSPPPDNDTSPGEVVSMWPWMRVWINFPSSVHIQPAQRVYCCAAEMLEQAGHTGRLQIQVSENVPPFAWRTSLPQIVRAITDFGRP
jgi:hypothetical protein